MEFSSDPYEQKLYQMFKSCDAENSGLLNEKSLRRLCELLELHDKGSVLIDDLSGKNNETSVSFIAFKKALLDFLGTEMDGMTTTNSTPITQKVQSAIVIEGERTLIIRDEVEADTYAESPLETSGREVSPKLMVGCKKYGRRSRPQKLVDNITPSDSEAEAIIGSDCCSVAVQRSSSHTDIVASRKRRPTTCGYKLKRCSSLPAQKGERKVGGQNEMENRAVTTLTKKRHHDGRDDKPLDVLTHVETLPTSTIIAIWERAGVSNCKGLLLNLGFDEENINLSQLAKVLEAELHSLEGENQTALLRASFALQSVELASLHQTLRQLRDENKKLRSDNKDANERIAIQAQEIDERHVSLENSSRKEIRLLEQRHAEVVRDLTVRLNNDRENWTSLTASLEAKLKTFELNEIKLKTDLELIHNENSALEEEQKSLQKQITELLQENIKLNSELSDIAERQRDGAKNPTVDSLQRSTEDELLKLIAEVNALQMENSNLRDKNDELAFEVESLHKELLCTKNKSRRSAEDASINQTDISEHLYKCSVKDIVSRAADINDCSDDWLALDSVLPSRGTSTVATNTDFAAQAYEVEVNMLKQKITQLETKLTVLQTECADATKERCKELEASLEQMQRAYEDCEDYWQSKLSEERQLFEKERQIYESEQQESDKKFTQLMEKVREYEEQFSKDGRLTPIDERDTLEQQYADLEAEVQEVRANANLIFEEKSKEIEALRHEIEDLRMRLGESVEILTGAAELSNEVAQKAEPKMHSPANSPISYLWHQSTIQSPAKEYHVQELSSPPASPNRQHKSCTSTTSTIFSTTLVDSSSTNVSKISPIQKPIPPKTISSETDGGGGDCDSSSSVSGKSFESNSVASTHSVHHNPNNNNNISSNSNEQKSAISKNLAPSTCSSSSPAPSGIKEELKRLKFFEISLREQIKDLSLQRDGLVMELQQLQEAKPVLEKAYARTAHPTLIQRVNQLELKNRHLQNVIKQQQHYTESLMKQTWQQHHSEMSELQSRIETQGIIMTQQAQRLTNADMLVKELYVENSHLTAAVQRMEQQRTRTNLLHQHHALSGLPGLP